MRKCAVIGAVIAAGWMSSGWVSAAAIAPSADTFVYQGLPGFNLSGILSDTLASGRSGSGHTTQTYVKFDVSGSLFAPGDTAKLRLYVRDNTPAPGSGAPQFGVAPSEAFPATAEVSLSASDWSLGGINWNNRPGSTGGVIDSEVITGIDRWVEWDVTSAVSAWLANPSTNFGLLISQPTVVSPAPGQTVYAIFNSSRTPNTTNLPQLLITNVIPEPSALSLLAGTVLLAGRRRRS